MSKNLFAFVTFGGLEFTKLAVQSIRETVANPYDLFAIVGKPGDNETRDWLVSERISHYGVYDRNMGFPYSINEIFDYAWKERDYDNLILMGNDIILCSYAGDSLINFANSTDYEIISAKQYDVRDLIKDYPETSQYFEGEKLIITDFSGKPWEKFTDYSKEIEVKDMQLFDIQNLCLYKKSVFDKVGYTDINYFPCLVPETPILTEDLRWIPIDDLEVGDAIVGIDEYPESPKVSRSYRRAIVEGKRTLLAECVKVTLSDGRTFTCSENHRWLIKRPISEGYFWREAGKLSVGERICAPLRTWNVETSFDAGWLSGLYDGEGCIHHHRSTGNSGVSLAQKEGLVLDKAMSILESMGIPFGNYKRKDDSVHSIDIMMKSYSMELLGRLQPTRLNKPEMWDGLRIRTKNDGILRIENIEHVGKKEVIDLQVSTKAFLANGLVTHNCYFVDNDYARRMDMAGIKGCTLTNARFFHFWSRVFKQGSGGSTDHFFDNNLLYYKSKWDGVVGKEKRKAPIKIDSRNDEEEIIALWRKR